MAAQAGFVDGPRVMANMAHDSWPLVTMYSINVFVTFTRSQLATTRYWPGRRKTDPEWKHRIIIHLIGSGRCQRRGQALRTSAR